jgi:hypothetical protein
MQKYVAPADCLISGQAMQAVVKSIEYEVIQPHLEAVMTEHGYSTDIDPETWYPLQVYHNVTKRLDSNSLVSIGVKVIDAALFPPEIDSIPTAMKLLIDTHHLNLRNVPPDDGYSDLVIEDRRVTFRENTSFAHDLFYGYIYGLARRYRPAGTTPTVRRTYVNPAQPDMDGALYEVVW